MTRDERLLQKGRLAGALVKIAFAWLYGLAISQLVLRLNHLPADPLRQGLAGLLLLLLLAVLTWQRYSLLGLAGILLTGSLIAYWTREDWLEDAIELSGQIQSWLNWAAGWLSGQATGSDRDLTMLSLLICLSLMLLSYLILARFNLPLLSTLILIVVSGLNIGLSRRVLYPWMFLAGLSLVAAFARQQKRSFRLLGWRRHPAQARFMLQSLPLAALAMSLAVWLSVLLPPTAFHSSALENLTDDIWGRITSIQSGGQRIFEDFSILSAGYYPLVDRLGGPVSLSKQPVLQVNGDPRPMLLRGAVSRTYSGNSWRRDNNGQVLRFDSPLWDQDRIRTFDLDIPDLVRSEVNPSTVTDAFHYQVTPVTFPFQTVFLAGRPLDATLPAPLNLQLFFDAAGQVFADGWIPVGETITIDAQVILTAHADFSLSVARIQQKVNQEELDRFAQIRDRYLQVPDRREYAKEGELRRLAVQLTRGETNPFEKALLIRDYLQANCQYNLNVAVPPADVDFVSWFLQTREGYCVYFATAMAMLCRLADIPARYVEGYYAPGSTEPDGLRIVTGLQAHAWSEIYLAGIGWVTIDPTPGGVLIQPDVTPTPGGDVTPTPLPDDLTPEPTIDPDATPLPTDDLIPDDQWSITDLSPWWLMILLLIPVIYLAGSIWWYRRRHCRVWLRRHFNDDRQLVVFYWQEIINILDDLGIHHQQWETPRQLVDRALDETPWLAGRRETAAIMLQATEKALFSPYRPNEAELAVLADLYDILEKTLAQNRPRLLFVLQRICYHRHSFPTLRSWEKTMDKTKKV